jgi:hypothetical protein
LLYCWAVAYDKKVLKCEGGFSVSLSIKLSLYHAVTAGQPAKREYLRITTKDLELAKGFYFIVYFIGNFLGERIQKILFYVKSFFYKSLFLGSRKSAVTE